MKLAIVSSVGGHLSEMLQLRSIYEPYEHFYILNDAKKLPDFMEGRTYFIKHSERDLWTLYNIWECWQILAKERPDIIMSTGAGRRVAPRLLAQHPS
jgi:beta-1,4-N-acetylglucosaminyltransferase